MPQQPQHSRRRRLPRVDEISAGGIALKNDGSGLQGVLIGKADRRGRLAWSLPKGKVESGETLEQTAEREVAEETGINATVIAPLGSVEYWFIADGRRIHKTVHHFLLRATGGVLSDADVEVTEVAWVPLEQIAEQLAYPDERDLLRAVPQLWEQAA
ncbi:MAG: NUDIX hydrolase [Corynebacteriales bacterium]|nr:NUDIX hydrolase [Mycobacteriales bacterium]